MCHGETLEAWCFALGGQPLNVGSCKVRFCGCLWRDKGCSQDTIGTQFWLIQWQINLGIFRFRFRTCLWLMTPWEGLPNLSKATNLCRHTRYLRISHCRTVRREFSKSHRYVPCVSLQISASSICFLLPMEWSTSAGLQWTTMPWGILYRHGTLMDLNLMRLLIGLLLAWNDHVWMDIWRCLICIYTLSN